MNSRNFLKVLVTVVSVWLIVMRSQALSIAPARVVYDPQEVLWFSVARSNLMVVYGDGKVGVWNFSSGEMHNQFSLPTNELAYPANNLTAPRHRQVALAMLTDASSVTSYDGSGQPLGGCQVELVSPRSCGFVGTTATLILADTPPNNAAVAAVDTSMGKTLWRSQTEDDVQTGTIALADGQCYVNFCRDRLLRARNQSGKLLWDWRVPKGKFAEPGYWPDSPSLTYVVVYESDEEKGNIADFVAISANNGKEVWRKKTAQFGTLKAISNDGKYQVFSQQGRVEITALPEQAKPKVVSLKEDVDAAFSPDGRFLCCLPALVKVSANNAGSVYTVARSSSVLSVVDVETGTIVRQFSLTPSVIKR